MVCLLLLALAVSLGAGESSLTIDSFTRDAATLDPLAVSVVLRNRGASPVRLWAPNNVEGMRCIRFSIRAANGKVVEYRPLVPPRAAGVATSVDVPPGGILRLPAVDLADARTLIPPGEYEIVALYRNDLAEFAPVKGVWTGAIRSRPLRVTF